MKTFLIDNDTNGTMKSVLNDLAKNASEIRIGVAFFSYEELLKKWIKEKKKILLLIGLQPPTSPALLKELLHVSQNRIEIKFLPDHFHSKIYIFKKNGRSFACVVGSSNFTNAGLSANREANVLIKRPEELRVLSDYFDDLWLRSPSLSPEDVKYYQKYFAEMERLRKVFTGRLQSYTKKHLGKRISHRITKPCKTAKDYYIFVRHVDNVASLVEPICSKEFPNIKPYLIIDHFWHWVKVEWNRKNLRQMKNDPAFRRTHISALFREYLVWNREDENFEKNVAKRVRFFRKALSKNNIGSLRSRDARLVYSGMNSGAMRTNRISGDEIFLHENGINRIRKSLSYLLWSSDDIAIRITRLLKDEEYRLQGFGESNIQELIGWVHPDYPIRNKKATAAVKLLGYEL